MIERFASCAKSTISIDDDPCQKETCLELRRKCEQLLSMGNGISESCSRQDLNSQVERQQRRIILLQKSKQLLAEEVSLLKQQLQSKNCKLNRIESIKGSETYRSSEPRPNGTLMKYSIIIQQKEEEIEILREQLKAKQKQLLDLRFSNQEMKQQITSKELILDKLRASSNAQMLFYKKQIIELETEIQLKNQEITSHRKLHEDLMNKEIIKWEHAVGKYYTKMAALEKQRHHYKSKIDQMTKNIHSLQQHKEQSDQLLASEKEKTAWLTRLLEEAKIEFMHSELMKLEKKEKTIKRKATPLHKQKFLNENRSYRSTSEASTALTSAKTIGEHPTSTPVAPFRLHPHSSQLFRLNRQDSEFVEAEWPNIVELNPFNQT